MRRLLCLALVALACVAVSAPAGAAPAPAYHNEALQLSIDPSEAAYVADPTLGECCHVTVKGCGNSARVCVPGDCGSDVKKRARAAFAERYDCKGNSVSGYVGDRCGSDKCDISL